jgi:filamentous hemagglutinin family protein
MTRKLSALTRVSSLAIAASLTASAAAQSLLGTPTVTFGSANISESTGTTDVDVFSSSAVIDWTPDDNAVGNFGAIAFQNSGTTATFRGFEGDYAVLNRINVADNSRKIFMNGTIQSFINTNVGGDIFFYSPSGFVVGANAVINVGSLVLSASPISVDGNGGFINGGIVTFAQADPGASITTVAGSQINALTAGSYVALVAPRVEHNGSIAVNGAAALVGAEAATINFRTDSLFDITVNMGTTDANGVVVGSTGSITGPACPRIPR